MKIERIGLSIIFWFLCVFPLLAQNVTKVTSANVNLRKAADIESSVITVIPKGTIVMVYEDCDCAWIAVKYKDNIGYVSSKYLKAHDLDSGKVKYYTNSKGERVQSPTHYNKAPAGATAICRDGTYSFSRSRRGTCSHHGGVARWL